MELHRLVMLLMKWLMKRQYIHVLEIPIHRILKPSWVPWWMILSKRVIIVCALPVLSAWWRGGDWCRNWMIGISTLKADKGLALQDIIAGLYDYIATITFSAASRVYLLDQLAQVEWVILSSVFPDDNLSLTQLRVSDIDYRREEVRNYSWRRC